MKSVKSSRQLCLIFVITVGLLLTGCNPTARQTQGLVTFSGIVAALALTYGLYLSIKEKSGFSEGLSHILMMSALCFGAAWAIGLLFIGIYNSLSPILRIVVGVVVVGLIVFLVIQFFRPPDIEKLKAKGNIQGLIRALGYKKDWAIRVAAAEALVRIGGEAIKTMETNKQIAVEPLVAALNDADYFLRGDVADALDKLGWEPDKSEAGFWYWVGKRNWKKAGAFGTPVISKLANLVEKGLPNVPDRVGITKALGKIGTPGAVEPLLAIFKKDREEDSVRQAAAKALIKIGVDGPENNDLLKLALFESISTKDPAKAVKVLFEKALLAVPILTTQMIEHQYEDVRHRWDSLKLVKGSAEEMRTLVLKNLRRYKKEAPRFEGFNVTCVIYARAAQVNTIFSNSFIPIRIWRAADSYYVCGNLNFKSI